jgi:hypothetical protein
MTRPEKIAEEMVNTFCREFYNNFLYYPNKKDALTKEVLSLFRKSLSDSLKVGRQNYV